MVQKSSLDTQREELEKVRKERQLALAKLNEDVKARDSKLKAREQDQAQLAKVLKTIEETLARQAREAEEARQKALIAQQERSEEHTSELQSLMRTPYAVFCLNKKHAMTTDPRHAAVPHRTHLNHT